MVAPQNKQAANERMRHLGWSGLLALIVWYLTLTGPLDQLIWTVQARLVNFEASGEIVFVGTDQDLVDPNYPQRRRELARALDNLRRAGADQVYLDIAFEQSSDPSSDEMLNRALRAFGGDAFLVNNKTGVNEKLAFRDLAPSVARGVEQVGGLRRFSFLGYVWQMPYVVAGEDRSLMSAPAVMAGRMSAEKAEFPINYGFDIDSIPTYQLGQLSGPHSGSDLTSQFRGKRVVIGRADSGATFAIPGHILVPDGLIHIYAAETLKAGYDRAIPGIAIWLAVLAGLVALMVPARRARRIGYAMLVLAMPAMIIGAVFTGARVSVGSALVLLGIYAAFRLRAQWKRELLLVDQETGLATFAALERDRWVAETQPAIVVARVHRFEDVRKTLPAELHSDYVLRIADRLKAASPDTTIYLGAGHLIAWCIEERNPDLIKEHLEGLRALFAAPLQVGGEEVDVSITFGVDIAPGPDVVRRLAHAVAAAERTTETYAPVLIAEPDSEEDLIWSISLQARIDAALANGEIYLDYQPKVVLATGEIAGVEALLRWRDPVRGMIPPDSFIRQCENSGRMAHVTRYVLMEACRAGHPMARGGRPLPIAVNISATMLHERAIVVMVREVLAETGFDPALLTLEITETYRISDLGLAASILRELMALGPRLSIDDFGVGASSLEALLQLPFSEIKIDRLFVARMTEDPKALAIVRSILMLGRQLRAVVVAEGVEDAGTLQLLRESGCRIAQGYGLGRPTSMEQIVHMRDRGLKFNERLSV